MTHTAHFPDVIAGQLRMTAGKATSVHLARALNVELHGLEWELAKLDTVENVNGVWMLTDTVIGAVTAYAAAAHAGAASADAPLDLATVAEDVKTLVLQHEQTGAASIIPRGHHGACDIEVFDYDHKPIAHVTVYADGRVEALPIVGAVLVPGTPAEWHAYIRAAATFVDAQDRMEEARVAGVDFREMLTVHDVPTPSATACENLVASVAPTALERADASRLAATRTDVTVYYRGRATTARRVEPLQNGYWRAELSGGISVLYETDPADDPDAVQRTT